jgi:predicted short-subunit dehydrogenase-like oxidoreductase (DUF2520 family)
MRIGVVGGGRVGTAVGVLLRRAGHDVVGVSGRGATAERIAAYLPDVPLLPADEVAGRADVVLLGVPDDHLAALAGELAAAAAFRHGAWVVHLSGANGLSVLDSVRAAGGRRLAVHPLQTFPDVGSALESIPGCWAAVTADDEDGEELGAGIARDVGAHPFHLADEQRPLYHAAAVFASNALVAVSAIAERLFTLAGVPDAVTAMHPLQEATIRNLGRAGAGAAVTGPAARGDAGTVERNLEALAKDAPEIVDAYVVLGHVLLDVAAGSGRLTPERRETVERVLARWS